MNITELVENNNIKPDRFGMAAISYIFKAFGDTIRSKEYWPWGETVNIPWEESKGQIDDLRIAIYLLQEAGQRINYDKNIESSKVRTTSVKDLQKRLARINYRNKIANKVTENINKTSKETTDKINIYNS